MLVVNLLLPFFQRRRHLSSQGFDLSTIQRFATTTKPVTPFSFFSEATADGTVQGTFLLDWMTWEGTPTLCLRKPEGSGTVWQKAWVHNVTNFHGSWVSKGWSCRLVQDEGTGLAFQGEWSWSDYTVSVRVLPHLAERIGLVACGRGLRRYIALVLDSDHCVRLIAQYDDVRTTLVEFDATWEWEVPKYLRLSIGVGNITAAVDDEVRHIVADGLPQRGAIGLLVEAGHAEFSEVQLCPNTPAKPSSDVADFRKVEYRC